jgi:hypothetical protein
LRQILLEQPRRLQAPLLQCFEIAFVFHALPRR